MNRTEHHVEAERMIEESVRLIAKVVMVETSSGADALRADAHLYLLAAQVHATLATCCEHAEHAADERPKPGPHLASAGGS